MTKNHSMLTLDFPAWVVQLPAAQRKLLAEIGRMRLTRSNPIAAPVAANMSDDVAIANLLFRVDDKAILELLMQAHGERNL
jgi:hypothetical protein